MYVWTLNLLTAVLSDLWHHLVVWLSGNALVSINEVTLRWAQLMLGWLTMSGVQLPTHPIPLDRFQTEGRGHVGDMFVVSCPPHVLAQFRDPTLNWPTSKRCAACGA